MSTGTSLNRLTIIYSAGRLSSKLVVFLAFFIYTRFLTANELGTFDIILSTINLLVPLISLQINEASFRWLIDERDRSNKQRVVTNSLCFVILLIVFFSIVFFALQSFIDEDTFNLKVLILLFLSVAFPLVQFVVRGLGSNVAFSISGIIYSVVFSLSSVLFLLYTDLKVDSLIFSSIIAYCISILYLFIRLDLVVYFNFKLFDFNVIRQLLAYSLPLVPNTISWWAISTSNKFLILNYLGVEFNGFFAVATKFSGVLFIIANVFSMAWQEKAIQTYENSNRDEYYSNVVGVFVSVIFSGILVLCAISPLIVEFVLPEEYSLISTFLPVLYLSVGFHALSSFYAVGYLASKETIGALVTTILGALSTLLSSFVFIQYFGLMGASLGVLLGYIVLFLIRVYQSKRYFTVFFPVKSLTILLLCVCMASGVAMIENIYIASINVLFAVTVVVFFNRILIHKYLMKINKFLQN